MYFILEQINEFEQIRLTVSEFRDVEYVHIRKYYLDFDETWQPTKEGISMALSIENARNLLIATVGILSGAESREMVKEAFGDILQEVSK